ncbi:hypothetical protein BN12_2200003 [Nostocoides japonicum T1-X7]|uniref:Helix-turn-helix domain-containing protein n=1 Tax=Nostocoides japonicum T1-X7 TaxID=1194083 RepID=A0A077LXY7_9MICO|nr:helix-turn-helix domain-containing protein [Tetrasphaera japonica]CCH77762.1 hypothetical protein BN12_2200003 [Tetrasphaera japonica T1-X7]
MTTPTPSTPTDPVWFSPAQAAATIGVSRDVLYRAMRRRELPYHKLGTGPRALTRIHRDDLDAWLTAGRVDARR